MTGTHGRHGRRRPRWRSPWAWLAAAAVAVVALVAGVLAARGPESPSGDRTTGPSAGCERTVDLSVAADPAVAAVVEPIAAALREPTSGVCTLVRVVSRASGEVAAELARPRGRGLAAAPPDVWIPDSSLWLAVARRTDVGAGRVGEQGPSIATTPVVVAMPRATAEAVGWPQRQVSWVRLATGRERTLGLADPRRVASTLAALSSTGISPAELATLARHVYVPPLQGRSPATRLLERRLDAMLTTEQDVVRHNQRAGRVEVAAVRDPSLGSLDFPYVVLRQDQPRPGLTEAADHLLSRLRDEESRPQFVRAGLRAASGEPVAQPAEVGATGSPAPPPAAAEASTVRAVVDRWPRLGRRGRVLVVVDTSGSMAQPLPGSRVSKNDLAKRALTVAVQASAPDSDMGLWTFPAARSRDGRVLVPLGPVDGRLYGTTRRSLLARAAARIQPVIGGGTGLYDTTLAAFRAASDDYAYGRLNTVLVVTDGRNRDDPGGISLTRLLDTLRLEFDGVRPVRIVTVAYGTTADAATLRRISDVTGGASYRSVTAAQVGPLFARALAEL